MADFLETNQVPAILDTWAAELRQRFEQQAARLGVMLPEGCWDRAVAGLDIESERRALAAAVAAGLTADEMVRDVAWVRDSGVAQLGPRLDALRVEIAPVQKRVIAASMRAAGRASGLPSEGAPAPAPLPAAPQMSGADRARIHALMTALDYGAPDVLAAGLLDACRKTMPGAPAATWTDDVLRADVTRAAAEIEAAFARRWTPAEAETLAAALASPEAGVHARLMERVTRLVMGRARPFAEALQAAASRECGALDVIGPPPGSSAP